MRLLKYLFSNTLKCMEPATSYKRNCQPHVRIVTKLTNKHVTYTNSTKVVIINGVDKGEARGADPLHTGYFISAIICASFVHDLFSLDRFTLAFKPSHSYKLIYTLDNWRLGIQFTTLEMSVAEYTGLFQQSCSKAVGQPLSMHQVECYIVCVSYCDNAH